MAYNSIDLTGQIFGRLKVLKKHGINKRGETLWICECSCGELTKATTYQLRSGSKKSCGCLKNEMGKINFTKHGESHSRLHSLWTGVKSRCNNPNHKQYKDYGGRGIKVCEEWDKNFISFRDFMLSIGYDEALPIGEQTIERINVNGNYEPSNCKLITKREQNFNKRCNHKVTYKGVTKTLVEFAEEYNLDVENLYNRINNYGYTIEEAIEKPVRKCRHKNAPTYEVNGEAHTMTEWAEIFGMTRGQLKSKTRHKTVEQAVQELISKQKVN